uniref:Uncharacterized protein n=1 Tax=Chromera velia CCMP2878 TaxID=1169474 RepID=A0A0G4H8Y6_9ALVE|eukprot:Cvel_25167.t1-p1 / transcript=Cvel_25167.t1 / gene=Cvel_25167 / organism=Chromera_velia_CCMP2878 / gene_product=hypothetical protein / transcript_product=hypothetical protein / location=Cvel_scaffold2816:8014-9115(-) / protein_length=95 / sequence_SO=supercontig / SO=protein_coding / is_pseudo=false
MKNQPVCREELHKRVAAELKHTLRMLYKMGPAPQIVYLITEDGGYEKHVTALLTAGIPIRLMMKKDGCGLSKSRAQYITLDFVREFLPNKKKRAI